MSSHLPLKPRHYPRVAGLTSETQQDLPEHGMRRRAVAMSFLQEFVQLPQQPVLVPSADGALASIIFTIPAYVLEGQDNPLWKVYQDLFLKLPYYTEFNLMLHEQVADRVKAWLEEHKLLDRTHLHIVPQSYGMYIWAQDEYEIVTDKKDNRQYLVQPHSTRRAADSLIGNLTAHALGLERITSPLYFEGGNILIGDDFFLMGADYAVDTMLDLAGILHQPGSAFTSESVENLFCQYFDQVRKLIFVGSTLYVPEQKSRKFKQNGEEWTESFHTKNQEGTVQPLFHIDMFISLAGRNKDGRYTLLVGDTRMASAILGEELHQYATPDVFDDVAHFLAKQGFEVVRNPLPVTYVDEPEEKSRSWYYASANNALVEILNEREKTVWLPTYGHGNWKELAKTDEANKRIWEDLGFKVNMLEDFTPFAENSGAVHCITKYLRRG